MASDRSFVEKNRAATERIRHLATTLSDDEFKRPVGEHWNVGVALVHLAFWDNRVTYVLDTFAREGKVSAPDLDIALNDISLPLWQAIPPRDAARIAVAMAEKLDQRLEALPQEAIDQVAEFNIRYVERARHRNEHLDEVDKALKA